MIFISILTLIVAKALPSFNTNLSSIYFTRISAIIFIYAGALSFNSLYIQSIGSGVGIYSGLFHVTQVSQLIEVFLLIIGSLILIAWPLIQNKPRRGAGQIPSLGLIREGSEASLSQAAGHGSLLPNQGLQGVWENEEVAQVYKATQNNDINYSTDYSLIVLFSTLGASLLISSSDLVSMYLSIELQSFGLYILSTLYRDSESSTNAGLKYFLLGGLSSCLILLGAGLIYAFTGLTNFESIYSLISVSEINYIIQGLSLGLILIIVGLLFKIAAAPLHNWSPDVYDDTPTIVTIWLTIMPKMSIIILLLELHTQIGFIGGLNSLTISTSGGSLAELLNSIVSLTSNPLGFSSVSASTAELIIGVPNGGELNIIEATTATAATAPNVSILSSLNLIGGGNSTYILKNLLLISSLLSLIIGTVVGLAQTRVKRLLAYSTISHIGFILLALAINTEQSIDSLLFYVIQYSITNLNVFLIIIALSYIINQSINNDGLVRQVLSKGSAGSTVAAVAAENELKVKTIKDIRFISELKGQFFLNPLLSLSLSICLFSMAGIPPLIGFFSKQFVLYSAVQSGYNFIAFVAILVSVVSASYYLKIINVLHTETGEIVEESNASLSNNIEEGLSLENKSEKSDILLTNFHSFLISSLTLSILLFILKPSLILNSTQLLSLSLFNF